ncbi:restriction endonuclease [Ensifer sp. ENS05]|uniref:restriction endonuclease n=1 Tax=Ensifer sp. ENS05 TaxID=2769277 RepID=UPI001786594F|nr:restriction endonuclease [Ensifer sp. ENS05]MBD9597355.1 restriction endonuclease [Ensifer sp. ENS05]
MPKKRSPLQLQNLQSDYAQLRGMDVKSDGNAARWRGLQFERLLDALFANEELDPRSSYNKRGEQIDGSFVFKGSVFLLEAKWHSEPQAASALYQFKGKVDGKLTGTIGVFISMSDFSPDTVDALIAGKSINIILFGQEDIDEVFLHNGNFSNILRKKIRYAAEEGSPYLPISRFIVSNEHSISVAVPRQEPEELIVICEGHQDEQVIESFATRILENVNKRKRVSIFVSQGKMALAKLANSYGRSLRRNQRILIVTDGDGDPTGTIEMLRRLVDVDNWTAIIPNPSIEAWLATPGKIKTAADALRVKQQRDHGGIAQQIDLDELRAGDAAFSAFYDLLAGRKRGRNSGPAR